ncbi:hypothetical protein FHX74_003175 [Friedmanniella endophytica]|uniref:DUF2550 domain-containing protein n=1 Tax=Microlunatus kandeliicorticis TaxID=1759536 RepID=A0A7W3P711_9ACTN|nr:DUF2550 domain-containing protein [Microlunatus kandeliicorticis]MBA8795539.1 hypothetical protein [Microlunatus kandeliicorticis]
MLPGWLGAFEVVAILIGFAALALLVLGLRRRWLSRKGGTFECSLRLRAATGGGGWALGVARYSGEQLEWYRFFSYRFAPRKAFPRRDVRVLASRPPDPAEAVALYSGQQVVEIEDRAEVPARRWQLAMSGDSLTGLLSWLEAAPPGLPQSRLYG